MPYSTKLMNGKAKRASGWRWMPPSWKKLYTITSTITTTILPPTTLFSTIPQAVSIPDHILISLGPFFLKKSLVLSSGWMSGKPSKIIHSFQWSVPLPLSWAVQILSIEIISNHSFGTMLPEIMPHKALALTNAHFIQPQASVKTTEEMLRNLQIL